MPFNFIEIEKRKSRFVLTLFVFLVGFYFFGAYLILAVFRLSLFLSPFSLLRVFLIACIAAAIHWLVSTRDMAERILDVLQVARPDPKDRYH